MPKIHFTRTTVVLAIFSHAWLLEGMIELGSISSTISMLSRLFDGNFLKYLMKVDRLFNGKYFSNHSNMANRAMKRWGIVFVAVSLVRIWSI